MEFGVLNVRFGYTVQGLGSRGLGSRGCAQKQLINSAELTKCAGVSTYLRRVYYLKKTILLCHRTLGIWFRVQGVNVGFWV